MTDVGKPCILMLDDDAFLLDMYEKKFTREGYAVCICTSVQEALRVLRGGLNPDIILFDIVMPNEDGHSFLEALHREQLAPSAYRIALTNQTGAYDKESVENKGTMQYILKASVTPAELAARIKDILAHRNQGHTGHI